jgi:hypothetical protein
MAITTPLKTTCFENGKKAMVIKRNKTPCFTNFDIISSGVVKRYIP